MFDTFQYCSLALDKIDLDLRNPRLVTLKPFKEQADVIDYLFEHEGLGEFLTKIANEGRNIGAERPYVVGNGDRYTVIEGNTRIAAYKLLSGLVKPSKQYLGKVPAIDDSLRKTLTELECTVAPSRDALLPIMANAHFGLGDKSKWGYLGSRKAVYDEWDEGRSVASLASVFSRPKGKVRDLILEYSLFLRVLQFDWSDEEREILEDPAVEFNPPIRFLQGEGHKEAVGVLMDRDALKITIKDKLAAEKLKHLVKKLVVSPQKGLGATANYDAVFMDFKPGSTGKAANTNPAHQEDEDEKKQPSPALKTGALFNYPITIHNQLVKQLAKEARDLNSNRYPAAGTFLLRNLIEAILKHIIDEGSIDPFKTSHSLESAINLLLTPKASLSVPDKQVLKEFKKSHLDYINLGAHGSVIPNHSRLFSARDCIDLFIKRNI